jgi:hypothetical protein
MRQSTRSLVIFAAVVWAGVFAQGPAWASSKQLIGAWRAVRQVEQGRATAVPPGKRITWDFAAGGAFTSTTEHAQGKYPIRSKGKWKLGGRNLSIALDGLARTFRLRIHKHNLELTELKQGKTLRQFFLERIPPAKPAPRR